MKAFTNFLIALGVGLVLLLKPEWAFWVAVFHLVIAGVLLLGLLILGTIEASKIKS